MGDMQWRMNRANKESGIQREREELLLCLSIKEKELNIRLLEFELQRKKI